MNNMPMKAMMRWTIMSPMPCLLKRSIMREKKAPSNGPPSIATPSNFSGC